MSEQELLETKMDTLRELTNIGCGHAANALSKMLDDCKVMIEIPVAKICTVSELSRNLGGYDQSTVVVLMHFSHGGNGEFLFVLPKSSAEKLIPELLNDKIPEDKLKVLKHSTFCEIANIIAGSYLSAISSLTGLKLIHTEPKLKEDSLGNVLDFALKSFDKPTKECFLLEAKFIVEGKQIDGHFAHLVGDDMLKSIMKSLGL